MCEKEQISQIAEIVGKCDCDDCDNCSYSGWWNGNLECFDYKIANALYNAGYRKQSEGEWGFDGTSWTCSECGEYAPVDKYRQTRHTDFCPNCGAHMKGVKKK